ncbi:OmpR family two-component response regulator [Oscillibacter valericigenes Sjm18-20]|nr:OmpR family two-component response regulator [Oscillibacter valericigenes Sjm18-20]
MESTDWVNLLDKKILVVDDEKDITDLIEDVLDKDGFRKVLKAYTGLDAIKMSRELLPDAIILDIMLPDIDGIEVCKKIREFSFCPIMFLSSKNDDIDKILGLSSGGDDYVTKPFSPREIVFRIKAQLRRKQYDCSEKSKEKQQMLFGDLKMDTDGCCVYKSGRELELTAREFGLLRYLAENPNKIINKEHLYEQVWGEDSVGCDNTVMVHIRHIREKIEDDPANPKLLQTVKGLGYRLVKRDS